MSGTLPVITGVETDRDPALHGRYSAGLDALSRLLAVLLFAIFASLLWQAIEVGSANSSFQRASVQITSYEASVQRLLLSRREAEQRSLRAGAAPGGGEAGRGETSPLEAELAKATAASDYAAEANRYFAALCDTGKRLAGIGPLPKLFMPSTEPLRDCPPRPKDLGPGEIAPAVAKGQLEPDEHVQAVRVVLDQYTGLANSYVLPILFGMMGALVFAMRDMITSPENMGRLRIVIGYVLRVFLGAIFGLIIGYVNVASTPAAGLAASPLLLSLVAGFASDAVISILDRLADAMSYDRQRMDDRRKGDAGNGKFLGLKAERVASSVENV